MAPTDTELADGPSHHDRVQIARDAGGVWCEQLRLIQLDYSAKGEGDKVKLKALAQAFSTLVESQRALRELAGVL